MVDTAIDAMAAWAASGSNANTGGAFAAADACDALLERARRDASPRCSAGSRTGIVFGANMTTLTLAFSRAVAATLRPGDRVVGTRLDHDANVTPWRLACDQAGAEHVLAPFDPATGLLDPADVIALIDERTRWVTLPGASNLIGTMPDLAPIVAAAHDAGARVFVDAVHLAPHKPIDVARPRLRRPRLQPVQVVRPARRRAVRRPGAARRAAQRQGPPGGRPRPAQVGVRARRASRRSPPSTPPPVPARRRAWTSLGAVRVEGVRPAARRPAGDAGVRVHGPAGTEGRTPTVAFTVDGTRPDAVATALAADRIATWAGHSYAVEVVDQLGLADAGGVVRAGVSVYVDDDDVQRLLRRRRRPPDVASATARRLLDGGVDAGHHVGVEPRDDVHGGEVLDDLARAAGAGDDGRHVRVLRRTRPAPAGPSSSRARRRSGAGSRPWRACRRPTSAWPASRSRTARRASPRGCRRGTCRSAGPTPAGSRSSRRSRSRRTAGRTPSRSGGARGCCTAAARRPACAGGGARRSRWRRGSRRPPTRSCPSTAPCRTTTMSLIAHTVSSSVVSGSDRWQ